MAQTMTNPRFPHHCRIYRTEGATSLNPEGVYVEAYCGECRKSSSDNIRSFNTGSNTTGKVDTADYRISMPGIVTGIRRGDLVDVTTEIGREDGMRVVSFDYTRLGEYETVDDEGRRVKVKGATAVLCNIPSN